MALGRVVYSPQGMNGLYLLPEAWYPEHRIHVHLNSVAVRVAREDRHVHLSNGQTLPYDRLVIATGARATTPSPRYKDCRNAFVLRSAAHAQAIRSAVQQQGLRRAVVIGGGVLGVEAAEALHHLGLKVTIVHRRDRLMERQLDAEGAQRLAGYLENSGIEVLIDARVEHFEIDEGPPVRLATIQLTDGRRVTGDLFVACAGVKPNVSLAADAGLEVGKKGIRVDERMVTGDAAILAVGDAAEPPAGSPFGATGLWPVAVQHGRIAAAALLGEAPPTPAADATRLVLKLKSEGIDLSSFGDTARVPEGAEVLTADPTDIAWWRLVVHAGRLTAGVYVGPPGTAQALTRAMQRGTDLTPFLPALRQRRLDLEALEAA
jgi:NAD(P)H-nitrite reductase large subunit